MHINTNNTQTPLYKIIGEVAALWTLANIGYYIILPLLGYRLSYNSAPIVIAGYFLLWATISTVLFWKLFRKNVAKPHHIWLYGILSLGSAALIWGLLYLFSFLPALQVPLLSFNTDIFLPPLGIFFLNLLKFLSSKF